jgi:hypothetical protein
MSAEVKSRSEQISQAMQWAGNHFKFQSSAPVTDHPWAQTFVLHGRNSDAYLKILSAAGVPAIHNRALQSVAERFSASVPQLLASNPDNGFFLYRDHQAAAIETKLNTDLRTSILQTYGEIQAQAVTDIDLLGDLPTAKCRDQFALLLEFLKDQGDGAPKLDGSLPAAYFLGQEEARDYLSIFSAARDAFERFLVKGDRLAMTINHCDLRVKNIARRDDDSLVIFDWDDAHAAPPGLSLHALFSGSYRPVMALAAKSVSDSESRLKRDRSVMDHYMASLSATNQYDVDQLRQSLPASICAGVMRFLLSFADYPVADAGLRRTIGKNMTRRFSDLLNVAEFLMLQESSVSARQKFAKILRDAGRHKRAERFERDSKIEAEPEKPALSTDAWLADQLKQSDAEGVFPAIAVSDAEHHAGQMSSENAHLAVKLFKRHGTLMVENAIPVDLVKQCHNEFMGKYERYFHDSKHDDALRVGDKRFMITVDFEGGFAEPNLFASPMVVPMLSQLLTPDFILGSLTAVASLPGSADQRMHKDNQALFPEVDDGILPSFSIAMIVPLIPLNHQTGATRVVKGSHRHTSSDSKKMPYQDPTVPLGSCFFMDSRLTHQGLANNSQFVRPIVSIVYQRPWYSDNLNYKKQKPLNINAQQFDLVHKDLKKLVEWAV